AAVPLAQGRVEDLPVHDLSPGLRREKAPLVRRGWWTGGRLEPRVAGFERVRNAGMASYFEKLVWVASKRLPVSILSLFAGSEWLPTQTRVHLLRRRSAQLASAMKALHFRQDILVRADGSISVYGDGIIL